MGKTTEGGRNIFEAAATFGYRGVKFFVEKKGVPVTATNADRRTAAHLAAMQNKVDVVKYLLGKNSSLLHAADNFGYTMYHLAVINGALRVVEYLIDECKVDVCQPNAVYDGNTPVHFAAESGQLKVFRYLVEKKGIDVNLLNDRGQPPVFLAAERRKTKIVKYVMSVPTNLAGIYARDFNNRSILFGSAMIGDAAVPRLLLTDLKLKIDVNARDDTGATVVFWAAKRGNFDFLKYMVSWKRADVNIANNEGRTALHEAATEGHVFMTKYLLEQGANKSAVDNNGCTPKDCATEEVISSCFKRAGRKRAPRSLPYTAFQLVEPGFTSFCEQSMALRLADQPSSGTTTLFGTASRAGGFLTLARGMLGYLAVSQHFFSSGELFWSPKAVAQSRIDVLAVDAIKNFK